MGILCPGTGFLFCDGGSSPRFLTLGSVHLGHWILADVHWLLGPRDLTCCTESGGGTSVKVAKAVMIS